MNQRKFCSKILTSGFSVVQSEEMALSGFLPVRTEQERPWSYSGYMGAGSIGPYIVATHFFSHL